MNYIEEHSTGEIDYEQLGRIACCSTFLFNGTMMKLLGEMARVFAENIFQKLLSQRRGNSV